MTLDELLALARDASVIASTVNTRRLAQGVLDLLGAGSLCGREPFEVRDGKVVIGWTNCLQADDQVDPDEALAIGADLIRAAGEARR